MRYWVVLSEFLEKDGTDSCVSSNTFDLPCYFWNRIFSFSSSPCFFFLLFIFIFKSCLLSSTVCVLKKCHFLFSFQFKRTLGQFTPAQWDKDEWHPLLGPWRFIQVLTLCIIFLTVELNTFFLKFCLWIPPRNPVIVYRLILWWLIAIPTIREYNSYLQDRYSLSLSLSQHVHMKEIIIFSMNVYIIMNLCVTCLILVLIFQKTGEKGWIILLAFTCYLHCWASHLHQVRSWYVSRYLSSWSISKCNLYFALLPSLSLSLSHKKYWWH